MNRTKKKLLEQLDGRNHLLKTLPEEKMKLVTLNNIETLKILNY